MKFMFNGRKVKKMTNTLRLKAAIIESGYTQEQIAKMLGISNTTFNYKINNKREFKASEIQQLVKILNLQDVNGIFFTPDVD